MRFILAAALLFAPLPALAQAMPRTVGQPVTAAEIVAPILAEAGPGTRWGVVVTDAEGREIVAVNPDGRFMPASNTKLVTTAAALWAQAKGDMLDQAASGAEVRLVPTGRGNAPDVVLTGRGDARMSAAPNCVSDCLATLADAVAARTRAVRDVIGDDTLFPDQRWSPGMSWNNIPTSSGTAISALSVDDNEIAATVSAGAVGTPPVVILPPFYTVDNRARTVAGDGEMLAYDRLPFSRVLVVTGTIGVARAPVTWRLGVDDPADYAAWRLAEMLRARGVAVTGNVAARHRAAMPENDPEQRKAPQARPRATAPLAALTPPLLGEDIAIINKQSQNLYAELLLRRLGLTGGTGSIADGQAVVRAMLAEAGVEETQVSLSDGSGMSSYNRVAPRAMVQLLGWTAKQPWSDEFRASVPIGGLDGTLRRRFAGTMLAGRIFAKTGTLNATNALAGWFTAASGRTLTFAIYANDVPDGVPATAIMDRALVALAAAN
jgi:D-alanyl-D-alanine carboxypeptidase/D-alanyl-D-alanine-endopeptidase (penicillin-binding protein 4)